MYWTFKGALLIAFFMLGLATQASAQNYPTKPVRILVGLAAGGGTDLIARIVAARLADSLGQPFLVENRAGVSGMVATEAVARSTPDGYTLLFSPSGIFVLNPTIYKKISYSPTKDFIPIAAAVTFPLVISVNVSVPVTSLKELVGYLKKNAGKVNCGGSGGSFELVTRLLTSSTGTDCNYIPYKGSNDIAQALMAGDLQFALTDTGPVFPALQGGKVRGLAVTQPMRDPTFPNLPGVVEAGFPELDIRFWMGLFAPAGTPQPIVRRIEAETLRAVRLPEVAKQLESRQVTPSPIGADALGKLIATEIPRWDAVRKAANIQQID